MIPWEIPSRPWQTVSADLFYTQQSWFLIVVDYYSKFPFVRKLHNLTARAVVTETKMLFAENGIPKTLQCDNGTQFTSAGFQQLARQYGFKIVRSSPHYPRGHGFVERQVQTVKKTILKCGETGEDIDLALLALRTTPLSSNVASPADLLNGRIFKSTLPGKIYPSRNQVDFRNWLKERQVKQSHYYNRHAKELPELHIDQAIHVQDPVRKTWNPAKVISQGDTPRSYIVETESGAQLRRNRIHLRPTRSPNNTTSISACDTPQGSTTITEIQLPSSSDHVDPQDLALADKPRTRGTKSRPTKSRVGREIRAPERLNLSVNII